MLYTVTYRFPFVQYQGSRRKSGVTRSRIRNDLFVGIEVGQVSCDYDRSRNFDLPEYDMVGYYALVCAVSAESRGRAAASPSHGRIDMARCSVWTVLLRWRLDRHMIVRAETPLRRASQPRS